MREDILQALSELIKEKTELKAEKVELGLVDDIKQLGFELKSEHVRNAVEKNYIFTAV